MGNTPGVGMRSQRDLDPWSMSATWVVVVVDVVAAVAIKNPEDQRLDILHCQQRRQDNDNYPPLWRMENDVGVGREDPGLTAVREGTPR